MNYGDKLLLGDIIAAAGTLTARHYASATAGVAGDVAGNTVAEVAAHETLPSPRSLLYELAIAYPIATHIITMIITPTNICIVSTPPISTKPNQACRATEFASTHSAT